MGMCRRRAFLSPLLPRGQMLWPTARSTPAITFQYWAVPVSQAKLLKFLRTVTTMVKRLLIIHLQTRQRHALTVVHLLYFQMLSPTARPAVAPPSLTLARARVCAKPVALARPLPRPARSPAAARRLCAPPTRKSPPTRVPLALWAPTTRRETTPLVLTRPVTRLLAPPTITSAPTCALIA